MQRIPEPAITTATPAPSTLYSVQYLRAFAAYIVVLYHVSASLGEQTAAARLFSVGAVGVDVFFVLSGFLMALIVSQAREVDGHFLLRRLIRIAPLYYLLTSVLFFIAAVKPELLATDRLDFARLAASFLFIPYPAADGSMTPILSLGWTLNYEMFFYCLIALATQFFGDRKLQVTVLAIIGLVTVGQIWDHGAYWRFYTDPILLEFAAGVIIFHYVYRDRTSAPLAAPLSLLIGGATLIAIKPDFGDGVHRFFSMGLPAVCLTVGAILTLNFKAVWLKKLGDWSYSTYLIHAFIIQLGIIALRQVGMLDTAWLAAICVPATVAASALLYRFYEMPMISELRWLCRLHYKPDEVRAAHARR
ncbi:MAG: acyltransferase [Rhizobiaceae bacterium]